MAYPPCAYKTIVVDDEGLARKSIKVGSKITAHGKNGKVAGLLRIKTGNLLMVFYEEQPKKKK